MVSQFLAYKPINFTALTDSSLHCRRFLWARIMLAKAPCWNSRGEEGMGRIKGSGEREEKTGSILAWGKSGVGFSTASKSCPDDQCGNRFDFLIA